MYGCRQLLGASGSHFRCIAWSEHDRSGQPGVAWRATSEQRCYAGNHAHDNDHGRSGDARPVDDRARSNVNGTNHDRAHDVGTGDHANYHPHYASRDDERSANIASARNVRR